MRLPRVQLSLRRMMFLVVVAGVCLAIMRIHPALGPFVAGISSMSLIRIYGAIDRAKYKGTPLRLAEMIRLSLTSIFIVTTILVASLLPGLFILPFYFTAACSPTLQVVGIILGAILGIPIASLLRRKLW